MSTSVVRAMRILELLAGSEKPLTLARVTEALGIPKSTAHNILGSLAQEGFVEISEPASYAIGLKAFEVGAAHLRATGTVGVVAPELARLTRALNITSHWAVLDGVDAVYLCKEDPPGRGIQLASSIGARLPSHITAVGKSCLAWLEPEEVEQHVALPTDATRGAALEQVLAAAGPRPGRRLMSTDDGEAAGRHPCVAAPVFEMSRPAARSASASCATPAHRSTPSWTRSVTPRPEPPPCSAEGPSDDHHRQTLAGPDRGLPARSARRQHRRVDGLQRVTPRRQPRRPRRASAGPRARRTATPTPSPTTCAPSSPRCTASTPTRSSSATARTS